MSYLSVFIADLTQDSIIALMTKLLTVDMGIRYNSHKMCLVDQPQANLFRELPRC